MDSDLLALGDGLEPRIDHRVIRAADADHRPAPTVMNNECAQPAREPEKSEELGRDFIKSGTENRVNVERQRYNEACQIYNTTIQSFPSNFIAGTFQFKEKPLYASEQGAEKAPKINLNIRQ